MIYKQVQQSTYLLDYAGQRFLVDPIMGGLEKGAAKEEIKFSDLTGCGCGDRNPSYERSL